ncbi:cytochrome b [Rubellimicrobium aerolatum]|uniref:Cytochrome b n=1 Tax=Rubellimicrobium aerolatum TaxID=490979 RepID=A0ABW0SDB3_9RHOB|nr:cytochrome b/b6 domain-containing protein [Rubellimicrobium aerolatum]MBP1805699.1 cytochrome b561 [Rubellimicrobium aerolatum]
MTTTPTTPSERTAHARHGYSSYQIALHWTVAVLVVFNLLLGSGMEQVYDAVGANETVTQWGPAFVHIALGVTIFLVMIARLTARLKRPVETAADSKHRILALLGRINHWAFYAVLLLMPPLGALAWFAGQDWAAGLHGLLAWVLLVLIALHIGGALLHLVLGENIIRRIVRPTPGT